MTTVLHKQIILGVFILLGLGVLGRTASLTPLEYEVSVQGIDNQHVQAEFNTRSTLASFKERSIYSIFALRRRIDDDTKILQNLLKSQGYFDAHATVTLDEEALPIKITFTVDQGTRYKIADIKIDYDLPHQQPMQCQETLDPYGVTMGDAVDASKILDALSTLNQNLGNCGYPFSTIKNHTALLDHKSKTVLLHVTLSPGPFVTFGPIRIHNPGTVNSQFIYNRLPFKTGETYQEKLIDQYRNRLNQKRLFDAIIIRKEQSELSEDGTLPIDVEVKDAKHRTIFAGAKYSTSSGIGGRLGWEHKNISGRADNFRINMDYSKRESLANIDYERPDFLSLNNTLLSSLQARDEKTRSYDARGYGGSLLLKKEFRPNWFYSYGLIVETSKVKQKNKLTHTDIVGIPLGFEIDTRDDKLDPKTGGQIQLHVTPEYGHLGGASNLVRLLVYGNYHFELDSARRHILALWGRAGSTMGISFDRLPADRRFYMGGSRSIRGYGHQLAGPLDKDGKPTGGKGLMAFGIEPRFKLHNNWGFVTFAEAGILSHASHLKFSNNAFYGVGFGVRYYTSFGPIRADLAIPLKTRRKSTGKKVDRGFQVYLSIGQAF